MIKICHIITSLDRGGAETLLFRLLKSTKDNSDQRHSVISLRDLGVYGSALEELGIVVNCLNLDRLSDLPRCLYRAVRILRNNSPDIVQTWLYHADLIGSLAALLGGRPIVIWGVHTVHLYGKKSYTTQVVRKICAFLSYWIPCAIIVVARAAANVHMKLGYNEKKIRLVHIGFDLPVIPNGKHAASNMKRVLGIDSDRLIIGCIGRYHPDKDYPTIIKAASIIRQTHPNVIFILVGPGLTSKNTSLMDHIEEHGQTDSFILLGERDDITNCLYLMDIFCLPSKTEAFPLVLGEAMAAARPVVSTDVGDARVMIGETGVVVPPGNPQRLAWALSKLIVISSEQREMMGIRSRNRIEERHTMKVMIGDIERIYHECLLSRSNRS